MGNRLCKVCGVTYEVMDKESRKVRRPACSSACENELNRRIHKCLPRCHESSLEVREVFFKDGTNHLQQYCSKCLRTSFLPKIYGVKVGLIKPTEEVDFLTDAARFIRETNRSSDNQLAWMEEDLRLEDKNHSKL